MSSKCIKIRNCFCFFIFSVGLLYLSTIYYPEIRYTYCRSPQYLRFSSPELQRYHKYCCLTDFLTRPLKTPSLESFIRASSTEEDQELRLSGLAVYSNLTNAWQPPVDVSKSNIHVNKIALITIASKSVCSLPEVAVNAQNAGYSVVIYFAQNCIATYTDTQDKLVIPFVWAGCYLNDSLLRKADQSDVQISVSQAANALSKMQKYLKRLYYWFLLGPLITLEWLRRTKKFCCMSGGQQVNEERGTEDEEAVGETSLHSVVGETQENYNQETEDEQTVGERQPLITVTSDPHSILTNTKHRRPTTIRRVRTLFAKIFGNSFAVGCGYVILIIAALPVGISSGGWSFFRFDENEDTKQRSFLDGLICDDEWDTEFFWLSCTNFLSLWWSPFQILCFFLYSRLACKTTWTVPTNFSKLIRSDWFASNMYLLILGLVVPYCSLDLKYFSAIWNFIFFTTYNTVCQICNLLFIIILNKHKFVTRYVFYISVCMICAYVESDIVAVFYFMRNSEGSLIHLKLTALRTVAIGLTLTLSLNSSMHIVRKLTKPQESLFEGLGEK